MSPIWCYHNCLSISIFRIKSCKFCFISTGILFFSVTLLLRVRVTLLERALYQMITNAELYIFEFRSVVVA